MGTCDSICLATTCVHLRQLAITCGHFDKAKIGTQDGTSFSSFGHPTQVDESWSQYRFHWYECASKDALKCCCFSLRTICVYLHFRLATHRKSVCTSWHFQTVDELAIPAPLCKFLHAFPTFTRSYQFLSLFFQFIMTRSKVVSVQLTE